MTSLLPYFESELASLTTEASAFAEQYPRVARALRLTDQGSDDPHVERLIQSAAWFSARVTQQLDDGYAGIAETLLDAIFPHYRRPFPSCSVVQFARQPGAGVGGICRGTTMFAGLPGGSPLRFTNVFDVDASTPDLTHVAFHTAGVFRGSDGTIHRGSYLELRWSGRQGSGFRVFVDGDPSLAAALRDALGLGIKAVLRPDPRSDQHVLADGQVIPFGFDDDSAVLEDPVGINPCFSLVREWLARPETFGFFDLTWPDERDDRTTIDDDGTATGEGRVILLLDYHVLGDGRELDAISVTNLSTRCGLVANLFRASVGMARQAHSNSSIQIRPEDAGYARDGLVSIESVTAVRPGRAEPVVDVPHFHAASRAVAGRTGPFWVFGRGAERETGREVLLLVDQAHQPVAPALGAALNVHLLCCDGHRPREIVCGTPAAELHKSEIAGIAEGWMISRPTAVSRFTLDREAAWRLVSHLAMNQLSLLKEDGSGLRRVIELYMPGRALYGEQVAQAIVGVRHEPVTRWLSEAPGVLVRGTGVNVRIAQEKLVGIGLHAMVHVLDRFLAQYAHINSFTQLTISCAHSDKEIYRCRMRTGYGPLI